MVYFDGLAQSQNKSKLRLTPSFVFAVSVTQAVLEIPKRRKLLLVSSKNWVTTGCLQFSACSERPIRLISTQLSRWNSENVQNYTTDKNWAIFRRFQFFQFYERSERPTRSERTYDPTQLNSTASWVELSWVELSRIGRSESRFTRYFYVTIEAVATMFSWMTRRPNLNTVNA